jgi:anti-sigma factor RsiW
VNCRAVRKRLVAYQDRELSPAEASQVDEHLAGCTACADLERRLAAVTPRRFLQVDPRVEEAMWARLDAAVHAAIDQAPHTRPERPWARAHRWLAEETRLPTAAVLAYGALLMLAVAWGASNWWAASQLQARLEAHPTVTALDTPILPDEIPADQYRPAAYSPDEPPRDP